MAMTDKTVRGFLRRCWGFGSEERISLLYVMDRVKR